MRLFNTLRLGIVGYGFVGKATEQGFHRKVEKFIVDPKQNTTIEDLKKFAPEIVFICVPTPMGESGVQDSSIIEEVVNQLQKFCPSSIKVVKSTVLPSILEKLSQVDQKLVYNPEFLREKHAYQDFINAEMIIFGGDRNVCSKVSNAYLKHSRCKTKEHFFTELKTASLIKYSINSFLASKVIFFNELFSLCKQSNISDDWETITNIISQDKRIGDSHMDVPGHDGRKGFGGACFPKDCLALAKYAEEIGVDLATLKTVINVNNKIRSQYENLDKREAEQNVTFDDKI